MIVAVDTLLDVRGLSVEFPGGVRPVREVSFALARGQRLGLVGESGSGKSLTALALMRLVRPPGRVSGEVSLAGVDLPGLPEREMAGVRGGRLAMVYQDPMSALNPVHSIGRQIVEAIRVHEPVSREAARGRAEELLAEVGIGEPRRRLESYPHQFSGGMRQRVMIAMAMAAGPEVLIADEPTTALDVTTQARIVDLLARLAEERELAVLLITHDLGIAARFCDEIQVMYAGRIVERSPVERLYSRPLHPYSEALLASVCRLDRDVATPIAAIPGQPPLPGRLPSGCPFHPRCPHAAEVCSTVAPPVVHVGDRFAECHFAGERA